MAFEIIDTQEKFDAAIQDRLAREAKKYEGFAQAKEKAEKYDALVAKDLEGQLKKLQQDLEAERTKHADTDKTISALTARATAAETATLKTKVAHEAGLPYELAARLTGDTEDALKEDAKALAAFVKPASAPPLRSTDPARATAQGVNHDAYAALVQALDNPT